MGRKFDPKKHFKDSFLCYNDLEYKQIFYSLTIYPTPFLGIISLQVRQNPNSRRAYIPEGIKRQLNNDELLISTINKYFYKDDKIR